MAQTLLKQARMTNLVMLGVLMMSVSCILPPELEVGGFDAGRSSPPVVVDAEPVQLKFPGPIMLEREDQRTLVLEIEDNDIEDTVYVQLYVDYSEDRAQPAHASCQASVTGTKTRRANCRVANICNAVDDLDTSTHVLEAMVSDREFITDSNPAAEGQKPFRAVANASEAGISYRTWLFICEEGA